MSDTLIVIPARIGSTRLKDKPLRLIDDMPLITHVCYRALEADVGPVILCSDDERVLQAAAKGVQGLWVKSGPWERCGSDRVAYVSEGLVEPHSFIINLQGDMPFIDPQIIRDLVKKRRESKADIVTPYHGMQVVEAGWLHDQFRRWCRKLHVGLYAFTRSSLARFAALEQSRLEIAEGIEANRAKDHGMSIDWLEVDHMPLEINTEADLKHANLIAQCIWRDADAGVSD